MKDWRLQLAEFRAMVEADEKVELSSSNPDAPSPKRIKRNRGRGVLPLLGAGVKRTQLRTRHHEPVDNDPPIFNGRHSPMER